ncbi:hypothetical protein E8E14_007681 [Neopestalotiopsis sp. 37M]|nr:hypothetical protein E8E14_007681 [Neopestalotiopsis sp. 37M]
MRFTSFLVAGVLALTASAQSATETATTTVATDASSTTSSIVATDSAQAAALECLNKCEAGDVDCQAHCITVPSPDASAVNATTECSANCVQGDGSEEQTAAYASCLQDCVEKYYFSGTAGTPTNTGAADSDSSSGSAAVTSVVSTITSGSSTITTTFASTKSSGTGTASGSEASGTSSSSSGNAGDVISRPASSFVGLLGALAAVLAL